MKLCKSCNTEKEESEFHKNSKRKCGVQAQCKLCRKKRDFNRRENPQIRAIERESAKRQKLKLKQQLSDYLKDKSCSICGESRRACLHFDHINPAEKSFAIATAISNAIRWNKILSEIQKCEILCANCHAIRTAEQFNWYKNIE